MMQDFDVCGEICDGIAGVGIWVVQGRYGSENCRTGRRIRGFGVVEWKYYIPGFIWAVEELGRLEINRGLE